MNKKLTLAAISSPGLIGALLALASTVASLPAQAATEAQVESCLVSYHGKKLGKLVCIRVSQEALKRRKVNEAEDLYIPGKFISEAEESFPLKLDFTDEESDAAVAIFDCDCPFCLNMLRQMRGLRPVV
jgi:hypothetical protein